jgi:8-oxo-dGTP pyrophosphatase MutT (NUDIX family)
MSNEKTMYSGKIFEVIQKEINLGKTTKIFEIARRSPGTRLLIIKDKKILIAKEYRHEHKGYDYRLPGGKVFDTLKEYSDKCKSNNILQFAIDAAKKECLEETGLIAKKIKLYYISKAGATIEWDLYYFIVTDFTESKQQLEEGEDITFEWKTFKEVKKLCLSNKINEDRTIGILLKYLEEN